MKKQKVIEYFGSANKASKNIGLTRQAVCQWHEVIPVEWALRLDKMTDGALPFHKEEYQ